MVKKYTYFGMEDVHFTAIGGDLQATVPGVAGVRRRRREEVAVAGLG